MAYERDPAYTSKEYGTALRLPILHLLAEMKGFVSANIRNKSTPLPYGQ